MGTLSGFQDFFLQPIIKDRSNDRSIISHSSGIVQGRSINDFLTDTGTDVDTIKGGDGVASTHKGDDGLLLSHIVNVSADGQ